MPTRIQRSMRAAGELLPAAPIGKAYLLGEFGHQLEHAEDHWDLVLQDADGCLLEINNLNGSAGSRLAPAGIAFEFGRELCQ